MDVESATDPVWNRTAGSMQVPLFSPKVLSSAPIGSAWKPATATTATVKDSKPLKKLKGDGGKPKLSLARHDTMIVPISEFEFTQSQIDLRFGGDSDATVRAVVRRFTIDEIGLKFDGDEVISHYGLEQAQDFVQHRVSRSFSPESEVYTFGDIQIMEKHANEIAANDWAEGDVINLELGMCMDEAIAAEKHLDLNVALLSTYALVSEGNAELMASLTQHLSREHRWLLLPLNMSHHWSLLVVDRESSKIHLLDSGIKKGFDHSTSDIDSAVLVIGTITAQDAASYTTEVVPVTQQPNSVDCGIHVMLNGISLIHHLVGGGSIDTWISPASSLKNIKKYRANLAQKIISMPLVDI